LDSPSRARRGKSRKAIDRSLRGALKIVASEAVVVVRRTSEKIATVRKIAVIKIANSYSMAV
jgi:hypothetical protein